MALSPPRTVFKRQPPIQQRIGKDLGMSITPTYWEPESVYGPQRPYSAVEFAHDVRVWAVDTEVDEHRQGRRLIDCFGGSARRAIGDMSDEDSQYGAALPGLNGEAFHLSSVETTLRILEATFLVHLGTDIPVTRLGRLGMADAKCLGSSMPVVPSSGLEQKFPLEALWEMEIEVDHSAPGPP